ncbi:MAG: homoserine kinase [Myxococcota bacterium]
MAGVRFSVWSTGAIVYRPRMALLTALTLPDASALAGRYGLRLTALHPIRHGSVNSNFWAEVADGSRVFLRIYEESALEAVRLQNELLRHLAAAGVDTPVPLRDEDGRDVQTPRAAENKPVCFFPFCSGRWIAQREVDEARMHQVGAILAAIHRAGEGYTGAPPNRFGKAQMRARLDAVSARKLDPELREAATRLERALTALEDEPPVSAEWTVVHGDLFRDNVLWHDDGTLSAALDFESASLGDPAFDLSVTLLAWCFTDRLEERLVRALVRGYRRNRTLSETLLRGCFRQARMAAIRFAVTRITDYELRPRGVVAYKDYRRFLARLDALEGLGADGLRDWLAP